MSGDKKCRYCENKSTFIKSMFGRRYLGICQWHLMRGK